MSNSEDAVEKHKNYTGDLGYDLVLDFSGTLSSNKRSILKLLSLFGRIVTSCNDL